MSVCACVRPQGDVCASSGVGMPNVPRVVGADVLLEAEKRDDFIHVLVEEDHEIRKENFRPRTRCEKEESVGCVSWCWRIFAQASVKRQILTHGFQSAAHRSCFWLSIGGILLGRGRGGKFLSHL